MKISKTVYAALAAFALVSFSACGEQAPAKKDDKKAEEKKGEEKKAEEKKVEEKKADSGGTAAAGDLSTGVPECDELLKRQMCTVEKMPEGTPDDVKAQTKQAFEDAAKAWKDAVAASPEAKTATAEGCKTANTASDEAYKAMGC